MRKKNYYEYYNNEKVNEIKILIKFQLVGIYCIYGNIDL